MSEEHKAWVHCYECRRRGDDWMYDGENNLVYACETCSWFGKTEYIVEDN